jgi:hypothetical protein
MSSLPLDLVHADRLDALQIPMCQTPRHCVFYRAKHMLPGRPKDPCHVLPREPPGPLRQEPFVAGRQRTLPLRPRHPFHFHPALGTINASHPVDQVHRHPPQGYVLKTPRLLHSIVSRPRVAATGTNRPPVAASLDVDFDGQLPVLLQNSVISVDKGLVPINAIEDSLKEHPGVPPVGWCFYKPIYNRTASRMLLFLSAFLDYNPSCLVKRSRALRGRNPTRNSQARAGE